MKMKILYSLGIGLSAIGLWWYFIENPREIRKEILREAIGISLSVYQFHLDYGKFPKDLDELESHGEFQVRETYIPYFKNTSYNKARSLHFIPWTDDQIQQQMKVSDVFPTGYETEMGIFGTKGVFVLTSDAQAYWDDDAKKIKEFISKNPQLALHPITE